MASPDTVINVGGIQYTLNEEKRGVNYYFRSYGDFRKTFQEVSERITRPDISFERIQQLFTIYMRAKPFAEPDFKNITPDDKTDLIRILKAYLKYLKHSNDISGKFIINIPIERTYHNINKILQSLEQSNATDDISTESDSCKKSKGELLDLVKKDTNRLLRRRMLLELAWLLYHPEDIRSDTSCQWAEMVSKLKDIRIEDLTKAIGPVQEEEEEEEEKKHAGGAMTSRIKTLLTVSHIAQMSKKPFIQTGGGSATDDLYDILTKELSLALIPLFDSIKSMYQPVYGLLESCMIRSRIKKRNILEPLLILLHISNHFVASHRDSHGIYRIRNGKKDLVHFITTQLQCTAACIQNMTLAKQKKYLESIQHLFPVIISSLPKRNAIPSIKKAPPLPTVQYITLDGNLTIPPFERFYRKGSESVKESTFQAMTDFFTTDDIYMAYSYSEEIPMNLYEIDFSSVNTKDTHIPITTHDSYFTSHPHHLQQFAPLVENALYTNGELILSIFIALKEKRSK
jgi:hypothetical protein